MEKNKGFTLVELMVGVAIVAILAAVAIPSYSNFVFSGEVKTAVSDTKTLALLMENYYQRNLSYPVNATATAATTQFSSWSPTSKKYTTVTITSTATTYTLSASSSTTGYSNCSISLTNTGTCTITTTNCRTGGGSC
jgi:type IV pilus assembly protein PilE